MNKNSHFLGIFRLRIIEKIDGKSSFPIGMEVLKMTSGNIFIAFLFDFHVVTKFA